MTSALSKSVAGTTRSGGISRLLLPRIVAPAVQSNTPKYDNSKALPSSIARPNKIQGPAAPFKFKSPVENNTAWLASSSTTAWLAFWLSRSMNNASTWTYQHEPAQQHERLSPQM